MRRHSIAGPLILILIGGLFLIYNLRPELPVTELISVYWPFLLIAWGLIRLVEVVVAAVRGQSLRSSFAGGEVVLIVLICLIGSGLYAAHSHGFHFGMRGLEMFGEPYDYPVSAQKAYTPSARIVVENLRGNLTVGGADIQEVRVSGHKTVRAFNKSDADRSDRDTPLEIIGEGGVMVVRTNQERVPDSRRISDDLEITVPRGVSVVLRGRSGDYSVTDLDGDVEVSGDRADVRLSKIGGGAKVDVRRSDTVRAVDVKGNVDLAGRGSDVELENIAGQVTISGSYGGTVAFKNLSKPLHYDSQNTELRVEALPGQISMDLSGLEARNLVGPIRLVTRTRDVKLQDFTNSLELETDRGDIELQPGSVPLAKIEARSRTGRIELTLPAKASFQLQASTERGDAVNDFGPPIEKEAQGRSASLKGQVGQGPRIHLTTERGSVTVRRAGMGAPQEL